MPIYEYECQDCGHVFDALQKISDDPLKDCPDCGKASLRKRVSAPNFRLKGGGWYETDFKDKNQRNLAGDAKGTATKSDGGGDSKAAAGDSKAAASDSKPAAGTGD